ncbi:hypothetical protein B0T22DRAFT_445904 [Podospora appendiculata]|uniref:Ecp2 effector protein domain-containing protein n=1 Tax=Podospora appendiculata TaxID=314037 RepID=A0AAE1C6Z5_9PEZI|nr:hypothetical protein B0T22DRAFT_445904 [Podospora appendiculata]
MKLNLGSLVGLAGAFQAATTAAGVLPREADASPTADAIPYFNTTALGEGLERRDCVGDIFYIINTRHDDNTWDAYASWNRGGGCGNAGDWRPMRANEACYNYPYTPWYDVEQVCFDWNNLRGHIKVGLNQVKHCFHKNSEVEVYSGKVITYLTYQNIASKNSPVAIDGRAAWTGPKIYNKPTSTPHIKIVLPPGTVSPSATTTPISIPGAKASLRSETKSSYQKANAASDARDLPSSPPSQFGVSRPIKAHVLTKT